MWLRSSFGFVSVMLFVALLSVARSDEPRVPYGTIVDGRFLSFVDEGNYSSTGLNWYWGDLPSSQVRTLRSVIPNKADLLSQMPALSGQFGPSPLGPRRWRIRSGYLWACFLNSPGNNPMENRSFFQIEFGWHRGFKRDCLAAGEAIVAADSDSWPWSVTQDWLPRAKGRSLQHIASGDMLKWVQLREDRPGFYTYDFVPLSPRSLRLFLLVEDEMEVWQYDFKPGQWQHRDAEGEPTRKKDVWLGKWTRQAEFLAGFRDPFHVTEISTGVAFVTDSGKCFTAERNEEDKWVCSANWNDVNRPLIAMIDVPDQKESYAFGKDFYFLLSTKPEPVKCRDVTLNRTDHGEPLRTSWECAKVLYEDGRIAAPERDTPKTGPTDTEGDGN
jgi:hypothetical protein